MLVSASKKIVLLIGLWYTCHGVAQNLVKNPSFENFVSCPERLGNFAVDVKDWNTPTLGSTDYFNSCSDKMGTPENFKGKQPSDFGKGYAGFYLYAPEDYREYLQASLIKPLITGKKYKISFYVSLAERSDFAVKDFGILFSNNKMKITTKKELSKKKMYSQKENKYTFFEIAYADFYSDTQDWILVQKEFTARGNENFLTLGNFKTNARTRRFKTKRNTRQGAYYYIDMINVEEVKEQDFSSITNDNLTNKNFTLNETYVFENLLFEFDKFGLLKPAKLEMQRLYQFLNTNTSYKISIQGHTDAIGPKRYNNYLSAKRAETVANYLLQLGLSKDRISWQGNGGERPIATNNTEQGRQKNRRVAFVITTVDASIK